MTAAVLQGAPTTTWFGRHVSVLPLERIYASKKSVGRPKDVAHLAVLEQTMKLRRQAGRS